jgi:uncharacterized protein (TIGR00290 family)
MGADACEGVAALAAPRATAAQLREPIVLSWSGGKDSAMALAEIMARDEHRICALLSTATEGYERVSMHGVRVALLAQQAAGLAMPLQLVRIPPDATNEIYESRMAPAFEAFRRQGVRTVAFGDLFLADIRAYREEWLGRLRLRAIFPLWHRDTAQLARTFIARGFEAIVTCVDARRLDRSFAGRRFDAQFLASLPPEVDPCGENGEFHTFVFSGPNFRCPVRLRPGEIVLRESWYFCDLLPE